MQIAQRVASKVARLINAAALPPLGVDQSAPCDCAGGERNDSSGGYDACR